MELIVNNPEIIPAVLFMLTVGSIVSTIYYWSKP